MKMNAQIRKNEAHNDCESLISASTQDMSRNDAIQSPVTENQMSKEAKASSSFWAGILSCCMYTFCSVSMVLSNKAISTSLPVEDRKRMPQLTVILFQCIVAVILVESAKALKWIEYPNFNFVTARAWLPLNMLFIGMLVTGFLSLVYVSVPMVTVFKLLI